MLNRRSLLLWQEGDMDTDPGLPFKRPVLVPDGLTTYTNKRGGLLPRIRTFLSRLKTNLRLKTPSDSIESSERTSQQQSTFRRSLIASALLEKEHARYKPPNKLAHVLCGSTVPKQAVWRKERSPLTEGHPILQANPDIHIPSENDKVIHWALDQVFSPNDSQISFTSSFGQ